MLSRGYIFLLPLLEYPLQTVEKELAPAFLATGVPESTLARVQLQQVVATALTFGSEHWCKLALAWLHSGMAVTADIGQHLRPAGNDMRHSQRTRHAALRLASAWELAE